MKKILVAFLGMISVTSPLAQTITARDLETLCMASSESEHMSCVLIIKVYMDGFIEGVGKGAIDTYKYDPQILALVRDIKMKDMAPRIKNVVEHSTCIQRVSVGEMINSYTEYVRKNPSMRQKSYREAMTRAIVASYCGR